MPTLSALDHRYSGANAAVPQLIGASTWVLGFRNGGSDLTRFRPLTTGANFVGTSLRIDLTWNADAGGNVVWRVGIGSIVPNTTDLRALTTFTALTVTGTGTGIAWVTNLASVTINISPNLVSEQGYFIEVSRLGSDPADTCTGTAYLYSAYVVEV